MLFTFLKSLHETGQAVLDPPSGDLLPAIRSAASGDDKQRVISELLEPWFLQERLRVPGEPLEFHSEAAFWGAHWLFRATCFYTFREIVEAEVQRCLNEMQVMPDSSFPAAHLSSDLMLQYLPALHSRARRVSLDDVLTQNINQIANTLPLSGVGIADRIISTNHPVMDHPGLCQYIVERAIRLKCRTTFTNPIMQQLAQNKLGIYSEELSHGVITPAETQEIL